MKDEEVVERMNDAFENGMNEYRKHCDEFSPHECVIQGMTGALKVAREGCYTEARDEYWRGALAAKDQTIASLQLRMDGCIAINQSAAAEIVELREHVAARSKPLSDEEWASADFDSETGEFYMQRYRIDALIAARTAPPPSEPQPWRLRMLEDRIKRLEQLLGAPDAGKRRSDVSQN